jgi:mRNA-degrading endonuclease RelE of RelBE toxin-antitoxin system
VAEYELFIESDVHRERKRLPGNIRQRIKLILDRLAEEPLVPHHAKTDLLSHLPL